MNKFSLLSLLSIALSTTSLSLSAIKLGDKIEIGDGFDSVRAKSSDIAITQQYGGFPKVPLVHPYHALKVQPLVVFSGRFPAKVLSMSGDVAEGIKGAMATTRVTPEDPFFVVVQPYIYENTDKEKKLEKTNQLLRPQYVYTENVDKESTKPYSEGISLKAQIVGLEKPIEITADKEGKAHHFGISVHNSVKDSKVVDPDIISSGANMAVETLKGETTGFYGFYKALGRTINGKAVGDTRGFSVLHILLRPDDVEKIWKDFDTLFEFAEYTGAPVTVKGIVDNFKGSSSLDIIKYTADIINEMCEDGESESSSIAAIKYTSESMDEDSEFLDASYEKALHVKLLISTSSWEEVYKYAAAAGISKELVGFIDLYRGKKFPFDDYKKKMKNE